MNKQDYKGKLKRYRWLKHITLLIGGTLIKSITLIYILSLPFLVSFQTAFYMLRLEVIPIDNIVLSSLIFSLFISVITGTVYTIVKILHNAKLLFSNKKL